MYGSTGTINATSFVRSGGTSSQFLMADGTTSIAGAGGTWATYDSDTGITTTKKVKIQNDLEVTGISSATAFANFDYLQAPFGSTVTFAVTVASKDASHRYNGTGSGNAYLINGVQAPFLTLTPGRTYRFTNDNTGSHPFKFYLEADKTTEYTSGVSFQDTYTEITVGDETPSVLHYQCTAHAYMGNAVQTNANVVNTNYPATLRSNLNVTGVTTVTTLDVQTKFDVYDSDSTFHNNVYIAGNLSIGGSTVTLGVQNLTITDKDIIVGYTTNTDDDDVSTDTTANHGGIAVASTEGSPLVPFKVAGINTLPDTYKQLMWVKGGTYGAGTTDAWISNYAVGVGSTVIPTGVVFAAGGIQFTDTTATIRTINSTNGTITNLTGTAATIGTINSTNGTITNLTGTAATIGTVKISSGIVTSTNPGVTTVVYYGDGSKLTGPGVGINSGGNNIGYGITTLNFIGSGTTIEVSGNTANISAGSGGGGGAELDITASLFV